MGKVVRQNKSGIQKIRAREIVPGDLVEIAGEFYVCFPHFLLTVGDMKKTNFFVNAGNAQLEDRCSW